MDFGPYLEASAHGVTLCTEGSGSSRQQWPVSRSLATCPYRMTQDGFALAKGTKAACALPQVMTHSTAENYCIHGSQSLVTPTADRVVGLQMHVSVRPCAELPLPRVRRCSPSTICSSAGSKARRRNKCSSRKEPAFPAADLLQRVSGLQRYSKLHSRPAEKDIGMQKTVLKASKPLHLSHAQCLIPTDSGCWRLLPLPRGGADTLPSIKWASKRSLILQRSPVPRHTQPKHPGQNR